MDWPGPSELRIGLGCMRLTDPATIAAAAAAGVTIFDTARAYEGGEALLARALRASGVADTARVVTKGGMARTGGAWLPDGRAKAIRADCEASLAALDGIPIDLWLLHAPDPRTPWRTSLRALARLADEGLVRRVGVANVNRAQLDEALALAPVAAVQVALSVFDDHAVRGGVVERCEEVGLALLAHSPLGGPRRAGRVARRPGVTETAAALGASPAEAALGWLLALSPVVVPIPGATRPETARSAARAAGLTLPAGSAIGRPRRPSPSAAAAGGDVVLVMGIPGAGKSALAGEHVARGYVRLNRDERGGGLTELAGALAETLAAGARRVVLDNTYLSRAARSHVLEAAAEHGLPVRCVWIDVPLAQAQVNLVTRLLERFGRLPDPDELRLLARREPGVLAPTSQMRTLRELEPPAEDEGFAAVEVVPFTRRPPAAGATPAVFVAASALAGPGGPSPAESVDPAAPHLVFDWRPDGTAEDLDGLAAALRARVSGPVEVAVCPHGGGPPRCWCRPPLPGLPLEFARRHGAEPAASVLVGTSAAHRSLAAAVGARFVSV